MNCYSLLLVGAAEVLCLSGLPFVHGADIKPIQVIDTECKDASTLGVSLDGERVFCFDGRKLWQIDLSASGKNKTIPLPRTFDKKLIYTGVRVKEDSWLLAVVPDEPATDREGTNSRYVLFDFATKTVKADWASHAYIAADLVVAPKQNRLIAIGCYGLNDIWIWDLKKREKVSQLNLLQKFRLKEEVGGVLQRTAIDPTSTFLAFGLVDSGMVRIWDLDNNRWHRVLPPREDVLLGSLIFLDDHSLAAAWHKRKGDDYVEIYDWKTGKSLLRVNTKYFLADIAASPDGRILAIKGWDYDQRESQIRLWDVAAKREIVVFKAHSDYIEQMTFTKDGKRLITIGKDGVLKVWDVERIVKPPKS